MAYAILIDDIPYEDIEGAPQYLSSLPNVHPNNKKSLDWCKRSHSPRRYASVNLDISVSYKKFDEVSFLIFYSCKEGEGSSLVRLRVRSGVIEISFSIADTSFYTDDQFVFEISSNKIKQVYKYFNEFTHETDKELPLEDSTQVRDFVESRFKKLFMKKLISPLRKLAMKELKHTSLY